MKCFYYDNLDGKCGSAIVAQYLVTSDKKDYIAIKSMLEIDIKKIRRGETIWIIGCVLNNDGAVILNTLLTLNCEIMWFDHHESTLYTTCKYPDINKINGTRSLMHSSATLVYMFCYNSSVENIPYYIQLIEDGELNKHNIEPNTTYFRLGMESLDMSVNSGVWVELELYANQHSVKSIMQKGLAIKQYLDRKNIKEF